jgi:hypothetical protein
VRQVYAGLSVENYGIKTLRTTIFQIKHKTCLFAIAVPSIRHKYVPFIPNVW